MRHKVLIMVLAIANFIGIISISAQTKKIGVVIDFLDTAYFLKEGDYVTPEEIRKRIKKLADIGVRKFYFRACPGVAYYPSKVLKMYAGDGRREEWDNRLIKSITENDVLREHIKACKEFGLEFYYWEPIFDNQMTMISYDPDSAKGKKFGEYPLADEYFEKNQHLLMKHRYADNADPDKLSQTTITKIKLFTDINMRPCVTREEIKIYIGNDKEQGRLKEYNKNFIFSIAKEDGRYVLVFDGLEIQTEIIKMTQSNKDQKSSVVIDFGRPGWCELYDRNGKIICPTASGGTTIGADKNPDIVPSLAIGIGRSSWDHNGRSLLIYTKRFQKYAGGVPCYAEREARDRRLAIAKEILTIYPDIDGFAYCLRTHARIADHNLNYGFNNIIVQEYQKRYGVNILEKEFDTEKFLTLRGDFFTEFIGEVGDLLHAHGKKFEVQAVSDYDTRQLWNNMNINNFFQIDKWAKFGYVDSVIILVNRPRWDPVRRPAQIEEFHEKLKGSKTKLSMMVQLRDQDSSIPFIEEVMKEKYLDDVILYEEETIYKRNLYDALSRIIK